MFHLQQGEYEYYSQKTRNVILITILYFALSLGLFALGYFTTGTKTNLLTIVAVLGLLPASKSAVNMIMYLKNHGCSRDDYEMCKAVIDNFGQRAYGLVFTTYKITFEVSGCIVKNGYVYGFLTNHQDDTRALEEHITTILKQNGCKAFTAMYTRSEEFLSRCSELALKESENEKLDAQIMEVLHEISL